MDNHNGKSSIIVRNLFYTWLGNHGPQSNYTSTNLFSARWVPHLFLTHHRQMMQLKDNIRRTDRCRESLEFKKTKPMQWTKQCFKLRGRGYITNITSIISQALKEALVANLKFPLIVFTVLHLIHIYLISDLKTIHFQRAEVWALTIWL